MVTATITDWYNYVSVTRHISGSYTGLINSPLDLFSVDGDWSEWSVWEACPVTCGSVAIHRNRSCDNPVPQYDGRECQGSEMESLICADTPCPGTPYMGIDVQSICNLQGQRSSENHPITQLSTAIHKYIYTSV